MSHLGHLRPSRDLLEYYRRKVAEYDEEYEKLVGKLEKYRCTYEDAVGGEFIINFILLATNTLLMCRIGF